jgi:hypothetical protein
MDEFDELIKTVKQEHEPSNTFVEATMKQLGNQKSHKRWNFKLWAPALAGVAVVIAIVFIALPGTTTKNPTSSLVNGPNTASNASSSPKTTAVAAPAPGADNAALNNDLASITSAINQENSDQGSANSAINDSQQEITVPTD